MSGSPAVRSARRRENQREFHSARNLLLWSILTILPITACVVPVAPEFQDPPRGLNYQPYFVTTFPDLETAVTVGAKQTFTVTVADPNAGDGLSVRWARDYPPYAQAFSSVLQMQMQTPAAANQATAGTPNQATFTLDVTCHDFDNGASSHHLVVLVSDNGFWPEGTLAMVPSSQYSFDSTGHPITVIGGWSILGCP